MTEAVGDAVHLDVEQDPVGGHDAPHAQRVVEAVAAGESTDRLADSKRDVVTKDCQRGSRWLE